MRFTLFALTVVLVASCSAPRAEQDRIIAIARQAVAANDTWADRGTYEVKRNGRGWWVTVWRIEGYDASGKPQFVFGGYRDIEIDEHGKVTGYHRGL